MRKVYYNVLYFFRNNNLFNQLVIRNVVYFPYLFRRTIQLQNFCKELPRQFSLKTFCFEKRFSKGQSMKNTSDRLTTLLVAVAVSTTKIYQDKCVRVCVFYVCIFAKWHSSAFGKHMFTKCKHTTSLTVIVGVDTNNTPSPLLLSP